MNKKRIAFLVPYPMTARWFLKEHIASLSQDYSVDVLSNWSAEDNGDDFKSIANPVYVPLVRRVAPINDLVALFRIWIKLINGKYKSLHTVTPKAGLIGMLAAYFAGVPVRIHIFTGQAWVTKRGLARLLLWSFDWVVAHLATHLLADSPSQRDFLMQKKVVDSKNVIVFGEGAICGVNQSRFKSNEKARIDLRRELGIPSEDIIYLYVGRLRKEKGVLDLAQAFAMLERTNAWLLFVGPDEEGLQTAIMGLVGGLSKFCRFIPYTELPEDYMAASDVICLPSYREGFGMVLIEAAAIGIPAIASKIYGVSDAVQDGNTGILFPPGNIEELRLAMYKLHSDPVFRNKLGDNARRRVESTFSIKKLTSAWVNFYKENV